MEQGHSARALVEAAAIPDEAASKALANHALRSESHSRLTAMVAQATSEPGVPINAESFDANPWLFGVQNGVIDLHTGELRPARYEDFITLAAPVDYQKGARLALWDQFLAEAIPDESTSRYVQKAAGATLVVEAPDDLILLIHGLGGTGKTTFLTAVQATLGPYAAAADLGTFSASRDAHGPQPDLARLRGKRMIAVSEVNVGQNIALLKRATGRDPIPTRSHHQDTFEMVPTWTLWIIANERPRVPDTDTGVWRRMREVPFVTRFEHPDPTIRKTLSNPAIAGTAILAWAIEGCLAWQREGLGDVPDAIRKATVDYQSEMNPVTEWLEDKTQLGDTEWTAYAALRDSYVQWAKANGISKPLGPKQFSQRLTALFAEHRKGSARGYDGISLLTE